LKNFLKKNFLKKCYEGVDFNSLSGNIVLKFNYQISKGRLMMNIQKQTFIILGSAKLRRTSINDPRFQKFGTDTMGTLAVGCNYLA
jgi:Fe-S cluster biosynthesis and repair protein YggX